MATAADPMQGCTDTAATAAAEEEHADAEEHAAELQVVCNGTRGLLSLVTFQVCACAWISLHGCLDGAGAHTHQPSGACKHSHTRPTHAHTGQVLLPGVLTDPGHDGCHHI